MNRAHDEERARDALAFEPLPASPWITVNRRSGISISVPYSEPLSRLLRDRPGSRWDGDERCWRYPYSAGADIRAVTPEIDRLAALATADKDEENRRRALETQRQQEARDARRRAAEHQWAISRPRPMQQRYLATVGGRPRHALILESIGDKPGQGMRCRVEQLLGIDGRRRWVGAALSGTRDYSRGNQVGSRGIMVTYLLDEGPIYRVSAPQSWSRTDTYFIRIEGGDAVQMADEEVEACLQP